MPYFFFFLFAMSAVLMLGKHLPFYWLHVKTPLLSSFRFPCRYLYLASFSLAVLAGTGLDALASEAQRARRNYSRIFLVVLLVCLILFLASHVILKFNRDFFIETGESVTARKIRDLPPHSLQAEKYGMRVEKIYESLLNMTNPLSAETLKVSGWLLALLILLYLFQKKRIKARFFQSGILLMIAADLFIFGQGYNPVADSGLTAPPPAARFLQEDTSLFRIMPVYRRADPGREINTLKAAYGSVYGLNYLFFPSPLLMRENRHLVETAGGALHPFLPDEKIALILKNLDLFGMLNVKYLLSERPIHDARLEKVHESDIYIYRNRSCMPRAFLVSTAAHVPHDRIPEALLDPGYDPAETVFLPEPPPRAARLRPRTKEVTLTGYHPEHVALRTHSDGDAFLVITDSFFSGWTAYLDGEEVKMHRANHAFRAIEIPAGRHEVVFEYRPHSFVIGRALSGFSLIVLLVIFLYPLSPFKSGPAYRSYTRF
jgi:hypothetical protein